MVHVHLAYAYEQFEHVGGERKLAKPVGKCLTSQNSKGIVLFRFKLLYNFVT